MKCPKELKYTADHEWIRIEGDKAVVGITDYAQSQLGDVVFIELPSVGEAIVSGKVFSVIESVKAVSDIYAPVSGTIGKVNTILSDTPEWINTDAYGQGWIAVVELTDKSELNNLLDSDAYEKLALDGGH